MDRDVWQACSESRPSERLLFLHDLLREAAARNNCHFLDLHEPFREQYSRDQVKFNSEVDSHWDEVGHDAAARALGDFLHDSGIVAR
jgi:hypothetical protein